MKSFNSLGVDTIAPAAQVQDGSAVEMSRSFPALSA
jgi:hypothetical protein